MNARDFALITLDHKSLPGWKTNQRISRPALPADARERGLADQIINGVIKNLLRLQWYIEHFSSRRLTSIDPFVAKILAVALYQMKFLDRIPESAAVDEAVKQTKRFRRAGAAGFVNAVLRNVGRQGWPSEPDQQGDLEGYAEKVLSHPRELFRRLLEVLSVEKAIAFCRHDNGEPPIIVRLGKGIAPDQLGGEGIEIVPHVSAGMVVARGAKVETLRDWANRGLGQVQDPTAAEVVDHMQISTGMRVLDRCAGMGTKTLQMWESASAGGRIVAMDASKYRCDQLREVLKARDISNVDVIESGKMKPMEKFDRILIDVPCSNSGVLARRPEARYREAVNCLVKLQREILEDTAPWLKPGGILVYSTCSIWPEENEGLIEGWLKDQSGLELREQKTTWPSSDTAPDTEYRDGGYWAAMRSGA